MTAWSLEAIRLQRARSPRTPIHVTMMVAPINAASLTPRRTSPIGTKKRTKYPTPNDRRLIVVNTMARADVSARVQRLGAGRRYSTIAQPNRSVAAARSSAPTTPSISS